MNTFFLCLETDAVVMIAVSVSGLETHDDDIFPAYTAVLELSPDQHGLTESRMKPVVDPPFNQVFMGSMSPFRAEDAQLAGCPCAGRSVPARQADRKR